MAEAGKGDKQRPTDHKAYSNNYDLIWGKKEPKSEPQTSKPAGAPPQPRPHN